MIWYSKDFYRWARPLGYNMHGQFVSIKPWSDELFEVTIQSGKQKLHGLTRNGPTFDANGNPAKTSLQIRLHSRNRQRVARRNVRMTTWLLLRAFFVPCLSAPRCFMFMQICNFNLVTNLLLHNLLGTCWGMCLLDMCKSFCRFHNKQNQILFQNSWHHRSKWQIKLALSHNCSIMFRKILAGICCKFSISSCNAGRFQILASNRAAAPVTDFRPIASI